MSNATGTMRFPELRVTAIRPPLVWAFPHSCATLATADVNDQVHAIGLKAGRDLEAVSPKEVHEDHSHRDIIPEENRAEDLRLQEDEMDHRDATNLAQAAEGILVEIMSAGVSRRTDFVPDSTKENANTIIPNDMLKIETETGVGRVVEADIPARALQPLQLHLEQGQREQTLPMSKETT